MTKRRGRGEGAVYQRSRDGRWVAVLDLGWQNGKRVRRQVLAGNKIDAQHKLAELRRNHASGLPLPSDRLRTAAFLESWLRDVAAHAVRASTFQRYSELVNLHLVPEIGNVPLARLNAQHLANLYAAKLSSGLAARTVGHTHRVLHRALRDAVRWGFVTRNVSDLVSPPRPPATEPRTLSPEEARRLLASAAGHRLEARVRILPPLPLFQIRNPEKLDCAASP